MSDGDREIGMWGGMPPQPWMYACGFRTVVGMLLSLDLPKSPVDTSELTAEALAAVLAAPENPHVGECKVLISAGVEVTVVVDEHTAIIGLNPCSADADGNVIFHSGELVQVNLVARDKRALSIERYFTNVRHMANT